MLAGQIRLEDGLHGFIQDAADGFQLIDFSATSVPCTGARWISQRGDIAGYFNRVHGVDGCTGHQSHGFVVRGNHYALIDVPGSTATKVLPINDDEVVVGNFTDSVGDTYGFTATPSN